MKFKFIGIGAAGNKAMLNIINEGICPESDVVLVNSTDKDIPKYIKLHIDDGLQLMNKELRDNPNLNGYDYLIDKITYGLEDILC